MTGLPRCFSGEESACHCKRCGFSPLLKNSSGVRNGNPLQYSCWDHPMDKGTWQTTVHGITKSDRKQLSYESNLREHDGINSTFSRIEKHHLSVGSAWLLG